jgi:hypothetical protein
MFCGWCWQSRFHDIRCITVRISSNLVSSETMSAKFRLSETIIFTQWSIGVSVSLGCTKSALFSQCLIALLGFPSSRTTICISANKKAIPSPNINNNLCTVSPGGSVLFISAHIRLKPLVQFAIARTSRAGAEAPAVTVTSHAGGRLSMATGANYRKATSIRIQVRASSESESNESFCLDSNVTSGKDASATGRSEALLMLAPGRQ